MPEALPLPVPDQAGNGKLVENIMHFARTLREAGLPLGPGRVLEAIRAVRAVGLRRRDDFYWALHAVMVNRQDQRQLFDQAFHIFWRDPSLLERALSMILPGLSGPGRGRGAEISPRLADALSRAGRRGGDGPEPA
ncbi:MAG: hypothetical protein ACE5JZ_04230, partial [Kiloniellales bacterium]